MIRKIILTITFLTFIVPLVNAADNTIGMGVFYGKSIPESYTYPKWHSSPTREWDCAIIHPTYGWILSDVWEVLLEGDIGYYNFRKTDVYSVGISLMTDYKVLGPLYLEVGCGAGYWTNTPDKRFVKNSLIGLIKYGAGAKIQLNKTYTMKIGYRFTHSSEIFADDTGANTHGILCSISKRS
jgi:hypothetical protein